MPGYQGLTYIYTKFCKNARIINNYFRSIALIFKKLSSNMMSDRKFGDFSKLKISEMALSFSSDRFGVAPRAVARKLVSEDFLPQKLDNPASPKRF